MILFFFRVLQSMLLTGIHFILVAISVHNNEAPAENLNSYKNGLSLLNDKGTHRLTFLSDQDGDTHTASQYFT